MDSSYSGYITNEGIYLIPAQHTHIDRPHGRV